MNEVQMAEQAPATIEDILREELARGDAVLATARPILRHLLSHDDQSMFNDEVIARVRGMVHDLAHQLLFAVADAAGLRDRAALLDEMREPLAQALLGDSDMLAHAHAITIETQLAERLQRRSGADPVLSPLLQDQSAAADPQMAALAMTVIAAQARHLQRFRRMELPLAELPGELFHRALEAMRDACAGQGSATVRADAALRAGFDESAGRLGRIGLLVTALGRQATRALALDHAGVAVFASALALASGQSREMAILSLGDRQFARLSLGLRAGGLPPEEVAAQFAYLHPEIELPEQFDRLRVDRAAQILLSANVAQAPAG